MKKILLIIAAILMAYFNSGCLRTYYPAVYDSSPPPMVFENNTSDDQSTRYIKADYSLSRGQYENETSGLLKASYGSVYTRNHTNANWEFFGYGGTYRVSGLSPSRDGNKSLFGMGADGSYSLNIRLDKLKFGVGSNLGLGIEFGEYYSFRRSAYRSSEINGNENLVFVFISAYPFLSYQFTENLNISTQVNLGIPGWFSPSLTVNNEKMVYWVSWWPDRNDQDYHTWRFAAGLMINLKYLNL